ncbi:MAG: hypothetical protein M1524_00290 [Patescibacteria group bacterium]|nr:hypothetical protein [Patescibacteria group bacterium]
MPSELKSEIAKEKPRDEEGHFVHVEKPESPSTGNQNPITKFFSEHSHYSKSDDDLLDIHVGNPLRKIVELLQQIKKQKAFSFTLKGSLGIMGVFLTLTVFGVLGGGKMLCDKGTQTEIGTIKTLIIKEDASQKIPVWSNISDYFVYKEKENRVVLVKNDNSVINLLYSNKVDLKRFGSLPVLVTGNYDSCSRTLNLKDPQGVELFR